jgi:hypothetical protein
MARLSPASASRGYVLEGEPKLAEFDCTRMKKGEAKAPPLS